MQTQTRRTFLARLLGLPAVLVLPPALAKQPDEYRIGAFHIAGFQYSRGPKLVSGMRAGQPLALVPEPQNAYDARAVRIDWRGVKIGYVPRRENGGLHALLNGGAPVAAHIAAVQREGPPWEAVSVAVHLRA